MPPPRTLQAHPPEEHTMAHEDSKSSSARDPRASLRSRDRDQEELDRRSHGGTQNGSTESAREQWLSDAHDGGKHKHQVTGPIDE
jgi:hypothetical protein